MNPTASTDGSSNVVDLGEHRARSMTFSAAGATQRALRVIRDEVDAFPWDEYERPKTRRDCLTSAAAADGGPDGCNAQRPCPFVSCTHHLALDVNDWGGLKVIHPDVEIEDLPETCALDVADRGGATLEEVGAALNVTRERIRQLEAKALRRLSRREGAKELLPLLSEELLEETRSAIAAGRAPRIDVVRAPSDAEIEEGEDDAMQAWLARHPARESDDPREHRAAETTQAANAGPVRAGSDRGDAPARTPATGARELPRATNGEGDDGRSSAPQLARTGPTATETTMPTCEWTEEKCNEEQTGGAGRCAHLCKRHRSVQYQRDVVARKRTEREEEALAPTPAAKPESFSIRMAAIEIEGENVTLEQLANLWTSVRRIVGR